MVLAWMAIALETEWIKEIEMVLSNWDDGLKPNPKINKMTPKCNKISEIWIFNKYTVINITNMDWFSL